MKTKYILIDFENVQPKDLARLKGRLFKTKVFCGANQCKIPFDLASELQPLGEDAEYIKIQGIGPNALDFHIAFYIGRLSAKNPDAAFFIISKDKGFEPLVKHLATENISCTLLPSLANLSAEAPAKNPTIAERIEKVVSGLLSGKAGRPRKQNGLKTYIKAQLNHYATDQAVDEVIARLTRGGITTSPDGKLIWPT